MSLRPPRNHGMVAAGDLDCVEVYCRLRPLTDNVTSCAEAADDRTLRVFAPDGWQPSKQLAQPKTTMNSFTRVFAHFVGQPDIYESVALPLVNDVLRGKNGLLFTYGITGSGKTHSMTGNPRSPGLLPRCLDTVFNSIDGYLARPCTFVSNENNEFYLQSELDAKVREQRMKIEKEMEEKETPGRFAPPKTPRRQALGENCATPLAADEWETRQRKRDHNKITNVEQDNAYAIFVSYVEIYNNYVYDLLEPTAKGRAPQSKVIREDGNRQIFVQGVNEVEVGDANEAIDVFIRGQRQRRVAQTTLNTESSRSHSVFTIKVVQAPLDATGRHVAMEQDNIHVAQLSLVDLAGSERSKRTNNAGERIKESGNINKSLMTLRQCIDTLRNNQRNNTDDLVPYRESRLTHLFKNYFGGEGKVRMVVCLNPSAGDYEENLHVMQFAEATQEVEIAVAPEIQLYPTADDLVPGRRLAAQHREAIEAEMAEIGVLNKHNQVTSTQRAEHRAALFEDMPAIELYGPNDETLMVRLKAYFENQQTKRQQMMVEQANKRDELVIVMRNYIVDAEANKRCNEENAEQQGAQHRENNQLKGENKQLRHELQSLAQRLTRYENDVRMKNDLNDVQTRKENELRAQVQHKNDRLHQVRNIVESGIHRNVVHHGRSASDDSNRGPVINVKPIQERLNVPNTPVSKVRTLAAQKFGGSIVKTMPPPSTPSSYASTMNTRAFGGGDTGRTPVRTLIGQKEKEAQRKRRSKSVGPTSSKADMMRSLMQGRKRPSDGDDDEYNTHASTSTQQKRHRN